jgi:hypothetical protein
LLLLLLLLLLMSPSIFIGWRPAAASNPKYNKTAAIAITTITTAITISWDISLVSLPQSGSKHRQTNAGQGGAGGAWWREAEGAGRAWWREAGGRWEMKRKIASVLQSVLLLLPLLLLEKMITTEDCTRL